MKSALSKTLQNFCKSSVILQKRNIFKCFAFFCFSVTVLLKKEKEFYIYMINADSFGVGKETQSLKYQNTTHDCTILNTFYVLSRLVWIIIDRKRRKSFIELD